MNYFTAKFTTILILFILCGTSDAILIIVPDDASTIQAGINQAEEGDTVLVRPDTYHEQIDFNGVNIVVASFFLLTSDSAYIDSTVIDGSNGFGPVVLFEHGEDTTAQLKGFTIQGGMSSEGGGIACRSSSPTIEYNIIQDNIADAGGGVFCRNSNAKIQYNIIRGSYILSPSGNPGGGICCLENSNCQIRFNIITDNENQDGGGLAIYGSSPTVTHNLIAGNAAFDLGGGIRFESSGEPLLVNNAIVGNHGGTQGDALYIGYDCTPTITNSIIWDNTGGGSTIQNFGSPTISYCDIEGGFTGTGNINEVPLFRNTVGGDFHLKSVECGDALSSPCIDAGDPEIEDGWLDCEWGMGTIISDMGIFGGPAEIQFSGPAPFELIAPEDNSLISQTQAEEVTFVWETSVDPDSEDIVAYSLEMAVTQGDSSPIDLSFDNIADTVYAMNLLEESGFNPPEDTLNVTWQVVASSADGFTQSTSEFRFRVINTTNTSSSSTIQVFSLTEIYPNPFNSSATIRFNSPVEINVCVEIFNLLGRQITSLADRRFSAGKHTLIWDGTDVNGHSVSAGMYLCRIRAGNFVEARKMLLLK